MRTLNLESDITTTFARLIRPAISARRLRLCRRACPKVEMKFCRVTHPTLGQPRYAFIEGGDVRPLNEGEWFDGFALPHGQYSIPLANVRVLAPVTPSKIVCVGRNYREHAAELGNKMPDEPLLFLKAPSAVIGDGDTI